MICSKCGSNEEGTNFCRKCGSPLVDPAAPTVPITDNMKQNQMNATDILIELNDELTKKSRQH